jgi:hypothetical protein
VGFGSGYQFQCRRSGSLKMSDDPTVIKPFVHSHTESFTDRDTRTTQFHGKALFRISPDSGRDPLVSH